jgi:hypothetical protein
MEDFLPLQAAGAQARPAALSHGQTDPLLQASQKRASRPYGNGDVKRMENIRGLAKHTMKACKCGSGCIRVCRQTVGG